MRLLSLIGLLLIAQAYSQELDTDLKHLRERGSQDEVQKAVNKGLAYLTKQQDPRNGAFNYSKMPNTMTALACLAFMADGHVPDTAGNGDVVRKGVLYLIDRAEKNKGYFGKEKNGRMYAQGICTLALCEAYGMMPSLEDNKRLSDVLRRAMAIIVGAQVKAAGQHFGGWHYEPNSKRADLSVTFWQVLALRSALNCNLDIPPQVIKQANAYVRRSYNKNVKTFTYDGNKVTHSMRAAGGICLLLMRGGVSAEDKQLIRNSTSSLINYNPGQGDYFYCQNFSLSLSGIILGDNYEKQIRPKLETALLSLQEADGSFKKHSGYAGGVYSSSFAVLTLSLRRHLLPLTQD